MDEFQEPIDFELWLNAEIFRKQKFLRSQFIKVLEEVGNSISLQELEGISPKSRGFKISKGNDLVGFPYQVLDLIRDFDPENGSNIRLLNWFGNGFFVTILLGKNKKNHLLQFLNHGFSYGLSESQWDYPDLILNQNQTNSLEKILKSELGFHHWIKDIHLDSEQKALSFFLSEEVKKILGILRLPTEQSRI